MRPRCARRSIVAALACSAVAALLPMAARTPADAITRRSRRHPNVLFVLTDDLDLAEMRYLPHVRSLIAAQGTTFDDYFVSNSLCCPSRTTTLRGQYAHNTGVWTNGGDNGGFERAHSSGVEADTVVTRLHRAGYATSLTGKYLNGYPNGAPPDDVPPGWDNWASAVSGNPYSEYGYVLNQNQSYQQYGHAARDYGTDVYVRLTDRFVRSAAKRHRPFFAYLSVYAPHQPATPARVDLHKFSGAQAPRTPSYDQADVSKSPAFVRDLPRFDTAEQQAIDAVYRKRIQSLQAVDRGVERLVRTLRDTKQLDDTYVVFASDNGFHLGQHRMPAGKQTAYEPDIHVPLLVRGPGVRAGAHVSRLAGNTDLAPTFEAMTGATTPSFTDGRSLLPLLRGEHPHWRTSYLVEHRVETGVTQPTRTTPAHGSTLEPPDPDEAGPNGKPRHREIRDAMLLDRGEDLPNYDAIRTDHLMYAEYATGDRELFDLRTDPDEIHNLAGTQPALEHVLSERVARLRQCRAGGCRRAEDLPLRPQDATGLAATMRRLR